MTFKREIKRAIKEAGFNLEQFEVGTDKFTYKYEGLTGDSLEDREILEAGNDKIEKVADILREKGFYVQVSVSVYGNAWAFVMDYKPTLFEFDDWNDAHSYHHY